MSFDTFKAEQKVIARAEAVLTDTVEADLRGEFKDLFKAYEKLLKTTNRLVKMSDRSEERLKHANDKIKQQQVELERAHHETLLGTGYPRGLDGAAMPRNAEESRGRVAR